MTAQIPEKIHFQGKLHTMYSEPLAQYFMQGAQFPDFAVTSTGLWRKYVGTWRVIDDRLYLEDIEAVLESGEPGSLSTIFPGYPERVFAHWFTGRLRLPQGKRLRYIHGGFLSEFEGDLFLDIEKGILKGTFMKANRRAPEGSSDEGTGPIALTIFPQDHRLAEG